MIIPDIGDQEYKNLNLYFKTEKIDIWKYKEPNLKRVFKI